MANPFLNPFLTPQKIPDVVPKTVSNFSASKEGTFSPITSPLTGTVSNSTPAITAAPGASAIQDFGIAAVQAPFRATGSITKSINDTVGHTVLPSLSDTQGSFTKALTGTEPIPTIGQSIKDTQSGLKSFGVPTPVAGPYGAFTALGSVALDLSPFGGKSTAIKTLTNIKELSEATRFGRAIGIADDLLPSFSEAALKANSEADAKALIDHFDNLQKTTKATPGVKVLESTDKNPFLQPVREISTNKLGQPLDQVLPVHPTIQPLVDEAKNLGYKIDFIDKKPSGYNGKHVQSEYRIDLYTKGRTPEEVASTLQHEIGHAVDYQRRGITTDFTGDSIRGFDGKPRAAQDSDIYFRDTRKAEAAAIRKNVSRSDHAANTQKEIYADAYRLYKTDPEKLQKIAPRIYSELDSHLKPVDTSEIDNLTAEIGAREDMLANSQSQGLRKYYGSNDPEFSNLDDIFSRSVGTERKSAGLDDIVREHGFEDVQSAHEAVLADIAEKKRIQELKNKLVTLRKESKTSNLPQSGESPQAPHILQKGGSSLPTTVSDINSPVQRLIQAIKEAKPVRKEQEKLYTQARAQKIARVAGVQKRTSGESGFYSELGQLKGELPKASYESIRKNFSQGDIDSLFNMIRDSPKLDLFEQITGRGALVKMLAGEVPTVGELKILNQVFPKEMIDALLAQRLFMAKFWEGLTNALNIPRSIMSSFDLSAPLRQGVFFVGRKEFYPAFAHMFKQFGSEKAFKAMQEEIAARPTFKLMKKSKLALTEMDRFLSDREEAFMSNWAEKIPVIGSVIKASGRAYVGFLNKLRADVFDTLIKQAKTSGVDLKENEKALMDISKFINSATGRGDLGFLNRAGPVLNSVFFSPRLMASRLNMLNPVYYAKLDPFVRKQALKSLLSFAGIAGTVLTLAKMGGADVGADPRSADFGKIKTGDTRYDILGGFQQYLRLASQLISGKIVSSTSGKVITLGEGYRPLTRKEILIRFFQGKENPIASFVTDFLQGEDAIGNKFNLTDEVISRFVPLIAQDLEDIMKERGAEGALMELPAVFGVGTQTYSNKPVKSSTTLNPFLK